MPVEIEKKYRLSEATRTAVLKRLVEIRAKHDSDDFEENILYSGHDLESGNSVWRLRRVKGSALLTYKERFPSKSLIKHQREDETGVANPEAMDSILQALGFTPSLVYEKYRQTWRVGKAKVMIDDLPFGRFMEIEADESDIREVEK